MGIILFNTIRRRTIPNPQFAYQNFLIENRVLRFALRRSGENYHGIHSSWGPPVLFVCLLVMLGRSFVRQGHCRSRSESRSACGSDRCEELLEQDPA